MLYLFCVYFRAKPRPSAVSKGRTYTEEELQNALRDILTGKLGTRRAAVIYGIPRSTLRNKVYKFTMENRQQISRPEVVLPAILDDDDDDGDDKDDDEPLPPANTLSPEELLRISSAAALQGYVDSISKHTPTPEPPKVQTPPVMSPVVDANMLLQLHSLLLAGGALPSLLSAAPDQLATLPDVIKKLVIAQQEILKQAIPRASTPEPNGQPESKLLQSLMLQQHSNLLKNQLRKSSTPEQHSSGETGESADDLTPIRIPSYKPVPGSSGAFLKNNGEHLATPPPPPLRPVVPNSPHNHMPVTSPSNMRPRSESQSPPSLATHRSLLTISDVIARSISKNFQEVGKQHSQNAELIEQYKRPNIQVKPIASMERFGQNTSLNHMPSSLSPGSTGTGGKGTRPKRGKYRNYDRDSLVEAVKAVQRGEMSVHRAGSYYGVPHSTLEYKVKERHLMRPRKREPKPQPLDGTSSSSASTNKSTIGSSSAASLLDKNKLMSSAAKPILKTPPFPATSPNGLKMSMFDPAAMAQLQYTSPFMWTHPSLPMQMQDFGRGAATNQPTFPPNTDSLFAHEMIQRLQDARNAGSGKSPNNGGQPNKTPRELAESIYDGSSTNGSFLDGLIRHSLDKKPAEMNHGALFEQLVKNRHSLDQDSNSQLSGCKRPGSPINFAQQDIKKERASPSSSDTDREDITKEAVENLIKLREGLTIKTSPRRGDVNGSSSINNCEESVRADDNS